MPVSMPENLYLQLNSGQMVDLVHPEQTRFQPAAMAAAGAKLCRFSGQTSTFYSVAEHSVLVSYLAEHLGGDPWAALWHEAGEMLGMNDLVTPLKRLMPLYGEIEDRVLKAVGAQFGFSMPFDEALVRADRLMLEVEGEELVAGWEPIQELTEAEDRLLAAYLPVRLTPEGAERYFLDRMRQLRPNGVV